jgi:hypothetical protein
MKDKDKFKGKKDKDKEILPTVLYKVILSKNKIKN